MGILTEEMKRVVAQQQLCYAASVTPDGKSNLSPKGSISVCATTRFISSVRIPMTCSSIPIREAYFHRRRV